jgi:hypothetical protein
LFDKAQVTTEAVEDVEVFDRPDHVIPIQFISTQQCNRGYYIREAEVAALDHSLKTLQDQLILRRGNEEVVSLGPCRYCILNQLSDVRLVFTNHANPAMMNLERGVASAYHVVSSSLDSVAHRSLQWSGVQSFKNGPIDVE